MELAGSQRDTALKALSDLQVKEIDAFVVDLEEMLAASDLGISQLLEQANTNLVDYVLSRVEALA
jgi:hypothetical protein